MCFVPANDLPKPRSDLPKVAYARHLCTFRVYRQELQATLRPGKKRPSSFAPPHCGTVAPYLPQTHPRALLFPSTYELQDWKLSERSGRI